MAVGTCKRKEPGRPLKHSLNKEGSASMRARHSPFRRQLLLGGLAATALALATGCSRKKRPLGRMLAPDATLLCLGDSLTFGQGAAPQASYPSQLEALTGHATRNAGVNGDTAAAALARLPALLEEVTPGLVLVSIGGNDFLRNLPLEDTRAALKQIVQTASANAQVVLMAQPQPTVLAAATGSLKDHPLYTEVATETGTALYSDGWSAVLSRPELRADPVHANAAGYRRFAEGLATWLREMRFVA